MGKQFHTHENEGIKIFREDELVEIITRSMSGHYKKQAYLEIRGIPGLEDLTLKPKDGKVELEGGIGIKVRILGHNRDGSTVRIDYTAPPDYKIERGDYPL